jgi:hypothetical protein
MYITLAFSLLYIYIYIYYLYVYIINIKYIVYLFKCHADL